MPGAGFVAEGWQEQPRCGALRHLPDRRVRTWGTPAGSLTLAAVMITSTSVSGLVIEFGLRANSPWGNTW